MRSENLSLTLLGSTGSVGRQALEVARTNKIKITGLCANKSSEKLEAQAREFNPSICVMTDKAAARDLKTRLADTDIKVLSGDEGITELINHSEGRVLNAIIGSAGLRPTLETLEAGLPLALANKESLVMAGNIVMSMAKSKRVEIRPVDSEHSAIWQCLHNRKQSEIKKLILTASGGPFFGLKREALEKKTLEDALKHPTWNMGRAITVDSATLMNKGFEVIEAAHLFSVAPESIEVLIHRESIIHSMVEYIDNSIMAQLSVPDMKLCINYALTYPERVEGNTPELDLSELARLTFYKPDTETFGLLSCAYETVKAGGALPAVLHAANEAAVNAFLEQRITKITDIQDIVCKVTDEMAEYAKKSSLSDIFDADAAAKERVLTLI